MSYYDYKVQVVQHRVSTHLGGVEKDWFGYDFTGNAKAALPKTSSSLL